MVNLFSAYISLPSTLLPELGAGLAAQLAAIGFDVMGLASHRAADSASLQQIYDDLRRVDVFLGIYAAQTDYSQAGVIYADRHGQRTAFSQTQPVQLLADRWAQENGVPTVRLLLGDVASTTDPTWAAFLQQISGQRNVRRAKAGLGFFDQVGGVMRQQWATLLVGACWHNLLHPDVPPAPLPPRVRYV